MKVKRAGRVWRVDRTRVVVSACERCATPIFLGQPRLRGSVAGRFTHRLCAVPTVTS